jgi:hypothetical protein
MSSGKIGIFLPGGNGDIMTAMSVLKYKDLLWPGKELVWFCSPVESDVLKFAPLEIALWEDFTKLIVNNGKDLGQYLEVKSQFNSVKDLEKEYFPAPWMYESDAPERVGKHYPLISKGVFGADPSWEWHPQLYFSDEEREKVKDFCLSLPHPKTVMLETDYRSGQSSWDDAMTRATMLKCREKLGACNFIFSSEKDNSRFFDDKGVVSGKDFTVRQSALINNYSDLFIGVSSGISVSTSCWDNKPTPKLQYTNTYTCSTVGLANGPIDLVEIHLPGNDHEKRYYSTLDKVLSRF